jgi:SagB-type dehydrogenase family enzyme
MVSASTAAGSGGSRAGLHAPENPDPLSGDRAATDHTILGETLATSSGGDAMPAAESKRPRVKLPRPDSSGGMTLERALATRRSVRDYGRRPLRLAELSQLLWAGQGITDRSGNRTTPSAGALFPLELIVVAGRVEGLEAGVYRYRPTKHDLTRIAEGDRRTRLANAALRQSWIADGAAVIVVTAIYSRTTGKYGERGMRYAHIEVGLTVQSLYLQATALGLGSCVVGAFHDDRVRELLELPGSEEPLAIMPFGEKR